VQRLASLENKQDTRGAIRGGLAAASGLRGLYTSERQFILVIMDVIILSGSLLFALWARTLFVDMDPVGFFPLRSIWWITLIALWFPFALIFDCYDLKQAAEPARSAVYAAGCGLLVSALYLVIPVISAPLTRSRLSWFIFAACVVLAIGGSRVLFARISRTESLARRVLIVGAGWSGRAMASEIQDIGYWSGLQLVGFVDDDERLGHRGAAFPCVGRQQRSCQARPRRGSSGYRGRDYQYRSDQAAIDAVPCCLLEPWRQRGAYGDLL